MKRLFFLLLVSTCCLITSCKKTNDKVYLTDLQYELDLDTGNYHVFLDDQLFSGTAWASDGKSYKIIVDDGEILYEEHFYDDGNIFFRYIPNLNKGHVYLRSGEEFDEDDYFDIIDEKDDKELANQQHELFNIYRNNRVKKD